MLAGKPAVNEYRWIRQHDEAFLILDYFLIAVIRLYSLCRLICRVKDAAFKEIPEMQDRKVKPNVMGYDPCRFAFACDTLEYSPECSNAVNMPRPLATID